jgi:signal transduction histidine kinase
MVWGTAYLMKFLMFKKQLSYFSFSIMQRWVVQAVFIVFAVLLSILSVTWILEKSLVKNALELEADAFIHEYQQDKNFPLPRTRNLVGYLQTPNHSEHIPSDLLSLKPGLYSDMKLAHREDLVPVYVKDFDEHRLFLIFEGANIDRLVGIFGLVPLTTLLIIIYISSWIAYRLTWRAASPILSIAQNIRDSSPDKLRLKLPLRKLSGETKELALALEEYEERITAFLDRERQFTADVSHELRTPITIIDGAAQFLSLENSISEKGAERVQMIRRASQDVNELINAFLLLAREQSSEVFDQTDVAVLVKSELNKIKNLKESSGIAISLDVKAPLSVTTPKKVLEIIVGNICRNACKYTQKGDVKVTVFEKGLMIADTGPGIEADLLPHLFERHTRGRGNQQAGEGIGLAIVKRLCDQFNWDISIENRGKGGVLVTLLHH